MGFRGCCGFLLGDIRVAIAPIRMYQPVFAIAFSLHFGDGKDAAGGKSMCDIAISGDVFREKMVLLSDG